MSNHFEEWRDKKFHPCALNQAEINGANAAREYFNELKAESDRDRVSDQQEYWIRRDSHKFDGVFYAWNDKGRDKSIDCIKVIDKTAHNQVLKAYSGCVSKFDACRAMLAYLVSLKNIDVTPPDDYDGEWHEYLIEKLGGNTNE